MLHVLGVEKSKSTTASFSPGLVKAAGILESTLSKSMLSIANMNNLAPWRLRSSFQQKATVPKNYNSNRVSAIVFEATRQCPEVVSVHPDSFVES